jgi:hypothetical protein
MGKRSNARLLVVAFLLFNHLSATAQTTQRPITNADVVAMVKSGISEDTVVLAIQKATTDFDTSAEAMVALKGQGVPEKVLAAMLSSRSETGGTPIRTQVSSPGAATQGQPQSAMTSKGCLAVKPIGSHAFRNIFLAGVAGALISKQQYQVVDAVDYPARIGQKYHGNDLQTMQTGGVKVVILDKEYGANELQKACH